MPFEIRFYRPDEDEYKRYMSDRKDRILAEIRFTSTPPPAAAGEASRHMVVCLDLPPIGAPAPLAELWCSEQPVQRAQDGAFTLAAGEVVLFGHCHLPVSVLSDEFEEKVESCYRELFDVLEARGYPSLIRVWNYFPHINEDYRGMEVYRRFVRARALAYERRYVDYIERLPAATVVGTGSGGFDICFLAGRQSGWRIENPRQVSAYRYPPRYGPRSPSFSRAVLQPLHGQEMLFISGTSSIVGHESLHAGDVIAQLEETLRNMRVLIDLAAQQIADRPPRKLALDGVKVYLRHEMELLPLQQILQARLGTPSSLMFLKAGLCRRELLVEAEAIARFV